MAGATMGSPAAGNALAVVGAAPGPAEDLAVALAGLGEDVVLVPSPEGAGARGRADDGPAGGSGSRHLAEPWDRAAPGGLVASLAACGGDAPALRAAVWAWTPPSSTTPAAFDTVDEAAWEAAAEAPVRECLAFLQGARRHFGGRPGSLVVLVPTMALLGPPPGLVAWATAAEGQRTLMKSAARNWSPEGLRSYAVAVTPDLLAPPGTDGGRLRIGLPPPGFGERPTMADVARVVATVTGPGFTSVTGGTVGVDGGQWMVP